MDRVLFVDSGGFGGDTSSLAEGAMQCREAAEVMGQAAVRARGAWLGNHATGLASDWLNQSAIAGACQQAWDVALRLDDLQNRLEKLGNSLVLAVDVYMRAELVAAGHLSAINAGGVGWVAEAKMDQLGQKLTPAISGLDMLERTFRTMFNPQISMPHFLEGMRDTYADEVNARILTTRNADTPVEESAALLSKAFSHYEQKKHMYHGKLRMKASEGDPLDLVWDRSEYDFGLGAFSAGIPAAFALPRRRLGRRTLTPRRPSDLVRRVKQLRDNPTGDGVENAEGDSRSGEFEIQRHDTPGRDRPSWSVIVRGTQQWLPGTTNPKDMQSNLALVGRVPADEEAAIMVGLEAVGAEKGDAVELVGHSQGGLVAGSLAATDAFRDRYKVAGVVTAGSPIQGMDIAESTPVLSFEHTDDFVAALDGQPAAPSKNHITVYSRGGQGFAHDLGGYVADSAALDAQGHADVEQWNKRRNQLMGFNEDTKTTQQRFTITRVNADAGS